ncbi:GTP-binding protein, partial [bacterium]|nr:GTP-binding protein [bacterium]
MPKLDVEKIRNVILLAHNGAGKTSLVESILLNAGATTRMGNVQEGNTVTDFEPEEIERKMTISSSIAYCDYKGFRYNLIDTPGFNNFLEDARGGIRAADGVVIVASAIDGVKAETKKLWSYANEYNIPAMIFINKIDKENADFNRAMNSIENSFDIPTLPLSIPIGQAENFSGIIDVVNLKAYKFINQKAEEIDIPIDLKILVDEYRKKLIETAAESDDKLIEKYFEGKELTHDEITNGIHAGAKNKKFLPVLCGSATDNHGVRFLMDAISFCIPSPLERSEISPIKGKDTKNNSEIERKALASEPFSAFVFKT